MDKVKLEEYCNDGLSSNAIADKENLSPTTIRYWLKKHNLTTKGWTYFDENTLRKIVNESKSQNEVLGKLNRSNSSNSYRSLKRALLRYNISIEHFMNKSNIMKEANSKHSITNEEIFIENGRTGRSTIKARILKDKLIEYVCFKCGQDDAWNGEKLILILDHANGVNNDNRLKNLRFVCPNCNAQLDTHCKGSKGLIPKEVKFKIKKIRKTTLRIGNRKVIMRPSLDELYEMLKTMTYRAIGKKYGVSDVAIRKWIVQYNKEIISQ